MDATLERKVEELAQEIAGDAKTIQDVNHVLRLMMKSTLERMLDTEMDVHLGRRPACRDGALGDGRNKASEGGAGNQRPGNRRAEQLLATGGGAHNQFLIGRLSALLQPYQVEVVVPDTRLVNYKEALIMALLGILRWRQEYTVLSSVTGASRDSIGGALWTGQEA